MSALRPLSAAKLEAKNDPIADAQEAVQVTLEWVDWFNTRRLLAPIGNIPPVEAEVAYCP